MSSKVKRLLGVSALAALLLVAMLVALNAPGFALASGTTVGSATAAQPNDLGPRTPPKPNTGQPPTHPTTTGDGSIRPAAPTRNSPVLPANSKLSLRRPASGHNAPETSNRRFPPGAGAG